MSNPYSSESTESQLEHCRFCPKLCRHTCPVSNADAKEQHTPQSKMKQLHQLLQGEVPWTQEEAEPLWACTGCRQCTTACEHGNEPGLVLLAGRKRALENGVNHPSLENYPERFNERQERLKMSLSETAANISTNEKADTTGFFPGCDMVDKSTKDIVSLYSTLDACKITPPTLVGNGPVCGGYPLWAGGFENEFYAQAQKVKTVFDGYKKVVMNCSACYHTVKSVYPTMGLGLATKVLPLSTFLAAETKKIQQNEKDLPTVYYHDPCYLARYQGVLEEPRRVLAGVAKIKDFYYSHTETECCGGAGLLPKTAPKTSDSMAKHRMKELSESGGGDVVTSCGTCAFMLKSNSTENVTVYDLPGYLAMRFLKN